MHGLRFRGEAKLVAIKVVAGRYVVAHLDGAGVEHARGEPERLVRLEQLRLARAGREGEQQENRNKEAHQAPISRLLELLFRWLPIAGRRAARAEQGQR